ncbi:HutD family protein [Erwinia sp. INIA-01]|uniref:HutD/Ves family protein n=1 Tax=Erwinia sp. INIA01 TaxID=2991500 RepID=UPI00222446B6|nr:HutD family protein [Erwinia sp. INIA01]MCW1874739.1 HutD family protein [Erwinia sp. INIA01]
MIHLFNSASLPVTPWRNGGGETREIISYPPGETEFDWRISIATIATDGDFSAFPGVDRIITLLDGEVELYCNDRLRQRLTENQPYSFPGEDRISARLTAGASHDFNIMARRGSYVPAAGTTKSAFSPPVEAAGVVMVISGLWQHGQTLLAADQGAWWENQGGHFVPLSNDALLLWGTLLPSFNHGL